MDSQCLVLIFENPLRPEWPLLLVLPHRGFFRARTHEAAQYRLMPLEAILFGHGLNRSPVPDFQAMQQLFHVG